MPPLRGLVVLQRPGSSPPASLTSSPGPSADQSSSHFTPLTTGASRAAASPANLSPLARPENVCVPVLDSMKVSAQSQAARLGPATRCQQPQGMPPLACLDPRCPRQPPLQGNCCKKSKTAWVSLSDEAIKLAPPLAAWGRRLEPGATRAVDASTLQLGLACIDLQRQCTMLSTGSQMLLAARRIRTAGATCRHWRRIDCRPLAGSPTLAPLPSTHVPCASACRCGTRSTAASLTLIRRPPPVLDSFAPAVVTCGNRPKP